MKYIDKTILKIPKKEVITFLKIKQYIMEDNVYSEFLLNPKDYFDVLNSIVKNTVQSKYPIDHGICENNSFFVCAGIKFTMISKDRISKIKTLI
jgi:hypothetical protein